MRRFLSVIAALLLIISNTAGSAAEEGISGDVYSCDFDLQIHLNPESFQPRLQSHIRGYSELFDMIGLNGNLTWSPETESIDIILNIVPLTNPSAALSMHFFGIPEHICMTSSLLGDETIWFNNFVLMEFALKTWNNLNLPLQYAVLLFPYVTQNAFQQLMKNWTETIGQVTKSQKISKDKLKKVSELWTKTLQEDQRLLYWITGLSVLSENHTVLEAEISSIAEYLLDQVSGNRDLTVRVTDGTLEWLNHEKQVLFVSSEDENSESWSFCLPATENGYLPALSYSSQTDGGFSTIHINGSYHLSDEEKTNSEDDDTFPSHLLDFSLDIHSVPVKWPADSSFSVDLDISGIVLPNFDIRMLGKTNENGEFSISVFNQSVGFNSSESVLTCSGTVVPVEPQCVPAYTASELTKHLNVFSVNDKTVSEFSQKIRRPLITGILNFLDEVPASACQSVMDDLEEYHILNLLLGEE